MGLLLLDPSSAEASLYCCWVPAQHPHILPVNSFIRQKPAIVSFCIPVLTNEQDIKSMRTLHSLSEGRSHLFSAKHNNKALITRQLLLSCVFFF